MILDATAPTVEFIDLPGRTAGSTLWVQTRYLDNLLLTPESVTLTVNGEEVAVPTEEKETFTEVELTEGENILTLAAMDVAGNLSDTVTATVILDTTVLDTAPTNLRAGISLSGRDVILHWDAAPNASAYNLYRSMAPIVEVSALTPIAAILPTTEFTDTDSNTGVTYYYALTSLNSAGGEGVNVSDNVNIAVLLSSQGGTALIADGTRLNTPAGGISVDPTIHVGVSIETPAVGTIPVLRGGIESTARRFATISQSGSPFTETLAMPATIALPYPAEVESLEELRVFFWDDDEWRQLDEAQIDADSGVISTHNSRFGAYQLAKPTPNPWDVKEDGIVDIFDLLLIGSHFGDALEPGAAWDVKLDGMVDLSDLALIGLHFGESYGEAPGAPAISDTASTQVTMSAEFTDGLFTILVKAEDSSGGAYVPALAGFQFDFDFDKQLASIVKVLEGPALKSKGTSYWLTPEIENGRATIASALFSSGVALSRQHSGAAQSRQNTDATVLAKITLKFKGGPNSCEFGYAALESIRLSNVKLANSNGRQIPYALRNFVEFATPKRIVRDALLQNYPNPFNPETWIPYAIAEDAQVTISVYNVAGQLVRTIDLGYVKSGEYLSKADSAYWNGRNDSGERVASGVYFYTIKAGNFAATKRLVVLK